MLATVSIKTNIAEVVRTAHQILKQLLAIRGEKLFWGARVLLSKPRWQN